MAIGNVRIQTVGGLSTLAMIPTSGYGYSFLNPLYRYANLTLPYGPNDPGLSFIYDNSTLAPVVLLYARFFNLLNESSVPLVANVGTSAFPISGSGLSTDCLDVRGFGAVGDGVTDDTAAVQAALNKAYQNYIGNQLATGTTTARSSVVVQRSTAHLENGSGSSVSLQFAANTTLNNTLILSFIAFNYSGTHQATPTVSDNAGNTWVQVTKVQKGEHYVYTYYATVALANQLPTVTITLTGRQFNSFIGAVLAEFDALLVPVTVDGTATAVEPDTSFVKPTLSPTGHGDLVIYSVELARAAGIAPVPPGDFTLVASVANPQPNGLNGSVPVTAMAYRNWTGTTTINSGWTALGYDGGAVMVAFRQVALPPAPPGQTVVCIPSGVNCLVNPVAVDHPDGQLWASIFSNGYFQAAYSLVINDGVTLKIDGSLIANPNVTGISPDVGAQGFAWFLLTNAAWLTNTSLGTSLPFPADNNVPWGTYLNGTAFSEGPRNKAIRITGNGQVFLNGQVQGDIQAASGYPAVALARFYCVDNSVIENLEIISPLSVAIEWGHSEVAVVNNLYIHDAPNVVTDQPFQNFAFPQGNIPGMIAMDMLRNSRITGNVISNCPQSIGVTDWAGYQNSIQGNKFQNCYGGYKYWDVGFEWGWDFATRFINGVLSPSFGGFTWTNVTHNSDISQNTAIGCVTSPPLLVALTQPGNPIEIDGDFGSDGFCFNTGVFTYYLRFPAEDWQSTPVTGTSFHDNVASGNSTNIFYGPLTAFASLANNTSGGGGGTVSNGVNTVSNEVPSGAIDGTNATFVLAHTPIVGTVVIFINGLQQVEGTDFSVSGKTITFVVSPNVGSTIVINYQYLSGN